MKSSRTAFCRGDRQTSMRESVARDNNQRTSPQQPTFDNGLKPPLDTICVCIYSGTGNNSSKHQPRLRQESKTSLQCLSNTINKRRQRFLDTSSRWMFPLTVRTRLAAADNESSLLFSLTNMLSFLLHLAYDGRAKSTREMWRQMQASRFYKANPNLKLNTDVHSSPTAPVVVFKFIDETEVGDPV